MRAAVYSIKFYTDHVLASFPPQNGVAEMCPVCTEEPSIGFMLPCGHILCDTCNAELVRRGNHRCPPCQRVCLARNRVKVHTHTHTQTEAPACFP